MEQNVLAEIDELKSIVSNKIERISKLLEESPQSGVQVKYQDVLQALFTPPKEAEKEATLIDLTPSSDLASFNLKTQVEKVENPFFFEESKVSPSSSNANTDQASLLLDINDDNFDPLPINSSSDNISKDETAKSNIQLLLDFEPVPNASDSNTNESNLNISTIQNLENVSISNTLAENANAGDSASLMESKSFIPMPSNVDTKFESPRHYSVKENTITRVISINREFSSKEIETFNLDVLNESKISSSSTSSVYSFDYENELNETFESIESNESSESKKLPFRPKKMPPMSYMKVPNNKEYFDVKLAEVINYRHFYIHLNAEQVKTFNEDLNKYYQNHIDNDDLATPAESSTLYCAYNEEDGYFYRGRVLRHAYFEKYWVLFVDFGKIKAIPIEHIYKLVPEYETPPVMALSCFLDVSWAKDCKFYETGFFELMRQSSSQDFVKIKARFRKHMDNRFAVLLKIKVSDDSQWRELEECDFTNMNINPEDLKEKLFNFQDFYKTASISYSKENLESYVAFYAALAILSPHLKLDTNYSVICPYIYNINKFLCIINSFQKSGLCDADNFTTNLTLFYEKYALEIENKINSVVVFRFKEFFFRGYILKCLPKSFQILSIDFAFIEIIPLEDVYPMLAEFSLKKYPMYVCLGALDNVMPAGKTWSPLAFETFRTWVQQLDVFQEITITPRMFLKFTSSVYAMDITLPNQPQSASELLIKMKYGVPMVDHV